MLPKKERLTRQDFNRFFAVGRRLHTSALQLVFHPYNSLHASVVVPKRVERSAVKRNKLRRRIYDILRREKVRGLSGVYIVLTKESTPRLSYDELREELRSLIGRTRKSG